MNTLALTLNFRPFHEVKVVELLWWNHQKSKTERI